LDSQQEIDVFLGKKEPEVKDLGNSVDFGCAIFAALMAVQENQHRGGNDHDRTVYIDTLGVGMLDFDLSEEKKLALIESGSAATAAFLDARGATTSVPSSNGPEVNL
jgi:NTE family protein